MLGSFWCPWRYQAGPFYETFPDFLQKKTTGAKEESGFTEQTTKNPIAFQPLPGDPVSYYRSPLQSLLQPNNYPHCQGSRVGSSQKGLPLHRPFLRFSHTLSSRPGLCPSPDRTDLYPLLPLLSLLT